MVATQTAITVTVIPDDASQAQIDRFFKLSGYKATNLVGSHGKRGIFVTSNGGKYAMDKAGKKLTRLSGPRFPNEVVEEVGDE